MVADIRERVTRLEARFDSATTHEGRIVAIELWRSSQSGAAKVVLLAWHFLLAGCGGLVVWLLTHLGAPTPPAP
jgi:hypothetical protein